MLATQTIRTFIFPADIGLSLAHGFFASSTKTLKP